MNEEFKDIELSRAFEIDGIKLTKIRMREPTVADQLASNAMKGDDATKEISLIANLCDLTPDDIKKLSLRDYRKLQEAFVGFTE